MGFSTTFVSTSLDGQKHMRELSLRPGEGGTTNTIDDPPRKQTAKRLETEETGTSLFLEKWVETAIGRCNYLGLPVSCICFHLSHPTVRNNMHPTIT